MEIVKSFSNACLALDTHKSSLQTQKLTDHYWNRIEPRVLYHITQNC